MNEQENQGTALPPRDRSAAYIEVADRLPRRPGKCATCGSDLVGFVAGAVDHGSHEAITASILAWFRFGCPVHDIFVTEWYGENEGNGVLRHESDPVWGWAPPAWRAALARVGWGIPKVESVVPWSPIRFGEGRGRVYVTDCKTLIAFPPGATLAEVEDAHGTKVITGDAARSAQATVEERARRRLTPEQIEPLLYETDGYEEKPRALPSSLGWGTGWDDGGIAFGEAVVPERLLDMIASFYPEVPWLSRGKLDGIRGVDASGVVVAVVMPVDVAAREAEAQAEADATKPCPSCGHVHAGKRLAYICIGCPCPETPGKPKAPQPDGAA